MSHSAIQKIHTFNDAISDQRRNRYAKFLPIKKSISDTIGPAMLVEGKHKLGFGKKII